MNLRPLPPKEVRYQAALHRGAQRPKPPIPSRWGVSINTRPLSDPWLNGLKAATTAINKKIKNSGLKGLRSTVHPALQKGVDLGLIGIRELLCVISIGGGLVLARLFLWFRRALYRLRIARPSAVCQWPLRITFWRRGRSSISWCAAH